jgi:pimeloyl-ACP methyl ester carboxylesterase
LLHGSPRSSLALIELIERLAERFCVVALDTPGYGLSGALPAPQPEICDYADAVAETLAELGIVRCGVYGLNTGASIAAELARRHRDRVVAAVLDGLPLFSAAERDELLANYCPPLEPALDGSHLVSAWTGYRDQFLYFPWYRRQAETRREVDMPDAQVLHDGVLDLLRAGPAYGAGSEAAFRHDGAAAVAALETPLLISDREGDALAGRGERLERLPPGTRVEHVAQAPEWAARIGDFLAEHAGDVPPTPPPPADLAGAVAKDYVSTSFGQLLLRRAGTGRGRPLLMLHASPGSAEMLVGLIGALAAGRPVLALDTLGNGDSDKPPWDAAEIGDYAPVVIEALDRLGVGEIDLYGTHTGAKIALETCLLDPARVRRVVLDGLALYDVAQRDDLLARYTPRFAPKDDGTHLLAAWSFLRDQTLFWPWYHRTRAGIRHVEPIAAPELHRWLIELLASGATYSIGYRAAFRHPTRERLPLLVTPALLAARATDMIHATTIEAAKLAPHATALTLPEDDAGCANAIASFLAS